MLKVYKRRHERGTQAIRAFTGSPRAPALNNQRPLLHMLSGREEHSKALHWSVRSQS